MRETIEANPATLGSVLQAARPGTTIRLRPGSYGRLAVECLRFDSGNPVVIDGGGAAEFDGGVELAEFMPRARDCARAAMVSGAYPGVYPIAHEATVSLSDCEGLVLRGLRFVRSWPTAIYVSDSRHLAFEDLSGLGSTYFLYAVGARTRHLRLERCRWQQDLNPPRLWKDVNWAHVHEKDLNPANYNGERAWDGSFFNGLDIAGDVEIAACEVREAFNGVHLFNRAGRDDWARNVHVHHCLFENIRDNPIEPENVALNWWIHDNEIRNAHKWFSFELARAGWIYVFRNCGWTNSWPGPKGDLHRGGSVFKFHERADYLGDFPGGTWVFNNSWYLQVPLAKRGVIRRFHHFNNAIAYCHMDLARKLGGDCDSASVFGKPPKPEDSFARDWQALEIEFANDCVAHEKWPARLRRDGYPIGETLERDPMFLCEPGREFVLDRDSPCRGAGLRRAIPLPDGSTWTPAGPLHIGWYQDDDQAFAGLTYRPLTIA